MWPTPKKLIAITALTIATALMGAGGQGGCDQPLPTVQQIDLNLPDNIRHCPYAPKSPGTAASRRQVATYLIGLRNAWAVCHGNLADVDRLYTKWQNKVKQVNGR